MSELAETRDGPLAQADWDMTAYFDGIDDEAYRAFRESLVRDTRALAEAIGAAGAITPSNTSSFAALFERLEDVSARTGHLGSYLGCMGAADARDETIKRETASAAADRVELEKIFVRVRAVLGELDEAVFAALCEEPSCRRIRFFLERTRERAARSMDAPLEDLAAELSVDGLSAWGRLYDKVTGSLEFDFAPKGQPMKRTSVAMTRTLLEDPDPEVRRAALSGANEAWASVAEVLASALNAIAGSRLTLYRRRGIDDFLEPALFDSAIARETLDAMWSAVEARAEIPRRYLRRKAAHLGVERMGFQDLLAPLPVEAPERVPWETGCRRVVDSFARRYPELADFARRAIDARWIDHGSRPGKRPGGFCSTSHVLGESRIFLTYHGAPGDVATLAHELGHAWHGWLMRDMRSFARRYPMTLAETASTFAENLVIDAALDDPATTEEQRAFVLDARLNDAAVYLLNIWMRFRFERAFYRERTEGEVGVSRLKTLMLDAQRACYGDALDPEQLDPWFWASKLHFYITGLSFYNFPYTFGYLFSFGLFARGKAEGSAFLPRYEALLRATGSMTAEALAREHLGVDLGAPDFWNGTLDLIEADLERFEALPVR